jgi:hypothetical protein
LGKVEIRRDLGCKSAVRAIGRLGVDRGEFEVDCMMAFSDISGFWPRVTEDHFGELIAVAFA